MALLIVLSQFVQLRAEFGCGPSALFHRTQPDLGDRQGLSDLIVQLGGDPPPLALFRQGQFSRQRTQLLLIFEPFLLGLLLFGDIADHAGEKPQMVDSH